IGYTQKNFGYKLGICSCKSFRFGYRCFLWMLKNRCGHLVLTSDQRLVTGDPLLKLETRAPPSPIWLGEVVVTRNSKLAPLTKSLPHSSITWLIKWPVLSIPQQRKEIMRQRSSAIALVICLFSFSIFAGAQRQGDKSNRPSPPGTATTTLNGKKITVDY